MRRSALIIFAALIGATPTLAADIVVPEVVPIEPAPTYSGWYIRGDIGYAFKSSTEGDWDFWNGFASPYRGIDDRFHYDDFSLNDGAIFSAGVGYRFSDMLRAEATLDYLRADINGQTNCPSYLKSSHGLNPVEDNCHLEDASTASILAPMANAYVDLPSVGPLTPYLGAGIGAAYVKYDDWDTSVVCPNCTYQSTKPGQDSWRFAMALMAGVSYDLSDRLKLDVGYRYLHINGGDAYGYDAMDSATTTPYGEGPGATGTQARDHGFDIHTVKTGLRYEF